MISVLFSKIGAIFRGMLYSSSGCFLINAPLFFFFPVPQSPVPEKQLPLPLLLAVVAVIVMLGMILTCGSLSISKKHLLLISLLTWLFSVKLDKMRPLNHMPLLLILGVSVVISQVDQRYRKKEVKGWKNITTPQLGTSIVPKGNNCSVLVFPTENRA